MYSVLFPTRCPEMYFSNHTSYVEPLQQLCGEFKLHTYDVQSEVSIQGASLTDENKKAYINRFRHYAQTQLDWLRELRDSRTDPKTVQKCALDVLDSLEFVSVNMTKDYEEFQEETLKQDKAYSTFNENAARPCPDWDPCDSSQSHSTSSESSLLSPKSK